MLTQDKSDSHLVGELTRENGFMKEEVVQVNAELGVIREELRKALVGVREKEEELLQTK